MDFSFSTWTQARRPIGGTLRILVVDDDLADLRLIVSALGGGCESGVRLIKARSLTEAMETLSVADVSIVLLDLRLPECEGVETVVRLRRIYPLLPIIVLTGADSSDVAEGCLDAGAQDFLPKNELSGTSLRRSIHFALSRSAGTEAHSRAKLDWVLGALAQRAPGSGPDDACAADSWRPELRRRFLSLRDAHLAPESTRLGAGMRDQLRSLASELAHADHAPTDVLQACTSVRGGVHLHWRTSSVDVAMFALELLTYLAERYRAGAGESKLPAGGAPR